MLKDKSENTKIPKQKTSVLISGSCGCGKSTAVIDAFKQQKGVLLAYSRTMASVAEGILRRFSGEYRDSALMVILSIVLVISSLNLNYTTKIPTITIEVDNRWESEYLEILLLIAKHFGATRSWHTLLLLSAGDSNHLSRSKV